MGRIAVSGSIAYDTIMVFDGRFREHILPERAHMLNVSFQVDRLERRPGGTAANIAYTLALLGENPVLCGTVGAHDFDDEAARLRAAGVDTSGVLRVDDVSTATCFITTDLDDNQITAFFAGAMAQAGRIDLTAIPDVSHVVVGANGAEAVARHIDDASAMGARLTFAPAQQIPALSDAVLRRGIETAWLLAGNDYEVEMMRARVGLSLEELRQRTMIAVTRGAEGSDIHTEDGVTHVPVAPAATLTDPTGAGDAYIAGLVAGLRAGLPPEVAARVGAAAASFVVERAGPQAHSFTSSQLEDRYRLAYGEALPSLTPSSAGPA